MAAARLAADEVRSPARDRRGRGHGPIRYIVEAYTPGRSIRFRFTGPAGFDGGHGLEVVDAGDGTAGLRHTLAMTTRGVAVLSWLVAFRPLHDALLEDALATAQASLGEVPKMQAWSRWVRLLRWAFSGGKAPAQVAPAVSFERTPATAGPAG